MELCLNSRKERRCYVINRNITQSGDSVLSSNQFWWNYKFDCCHRKCAHALGLILNNLWYNNWGGKKREHCLQPKLTVSLRSWVQLSADYTWLGKHIWFIWTPQLRVWKPPEWASLICTCFRFSLSLSELIGSRWWSDAILLSLLLFLTD